MRVAIRNINSGETLSKNAVVLKGAISKGLGLMGKRKTDGALFVLRRESKMDATIHMLFMLMSLDVVWTNKNGIVVDIKRNVKSTSFFDIKSWKFHTPKKKAQYIIELPAGAASKTKIDDALHFEYSE